MQLGPLGSSLGQAVLGAVRTRDVPELGLVGRMDSHTDQWGMKRHDKWGLATLCMWPGSSRQLVRELQRLFPEEGELSLAPEGPVER